MENLFSQPESLITAAATVVLAILTGWYVRLTHHMLNESRSTREPNVWVDVEVSSYLVKFLVGNSGPSPAKNLRFSIVDKVPWRCMEGYAFGFSEIVGVKNGISYLAPSRTLKFEAGFIDDNKTFTDENSEVTISIEYDSEQKRI